MLKRVRIEVEEETAEACAEALWKYEHAIQTAEARRYVRGWPITLSSEGDLETPEEQYRIREHPWSDGVNPRSFYNGELGRELVEEVIEFDEGIPGYKARRVIRFRRIDTRSSRFVELVDAVGEDDERTDHLRDVVAQVGVRE